MPKNYSSGEVLEALHKAGFMDVSPRGSQLKLRRIVGGQTLNVVVKHPSKSIPLGTFRSIPRQAELTLDELERLLV